MPMIELVEIRPLADLRPLVFLRVRAVSAAAGGNIILRATDATASPDRRTTVFGRGAWPVP